MLAVKVDSRESSNIPPFGYVIDYMTYGGIYRDVYIEVRSETHLQDGFYLNGRKVKIRGLNRYQSYPYVGYAMPKSMQCMDADILKYELGVNAVRTSHYPQSHYFMERCDEIGLLVFTEIPGWQHIGDEEWKRQAVARELDPYRQTGGVRAHPKSSFLEDVYTYNDFSHDGKAKGCLPKKAVTRRDDME